MTVAAALIKKVQALGVSLSVNGMRLAVEAPSGVITDELREQLFQFKPAILAELNAGAPSSAKHPASGAIREVASLLAKAYRRYQVQVERREGGSCDDRLANPAGKSVHGGGS